jgi:antitoxin component of MazEF toxin-antitoxin module
MAMITGKEAQMKTIIRKTDGKARLTLPSDFASCLVTVERDGDELRVRKARKVVTRRYTFKQLMAGVTKENIHTEIKTGPPRGKEAL